MNLTLLRALVEKKSGYPPLSLYGVAVAPVRDLLSHPDVNEYVLYCLPLKDYLASQSQLAVCCLESIVGEIHPQAGPGGFIRPFGYLVVASSAGGNVVCFHSPTGKVYWVDHEAFADGGISFQNRSTGEWVFLEKYSPENVQRAMVPLSDSIETFLIELLSDQLTAQIGALD